MQDFTFAATMALKRDCREGGRLEISKEAAAAISSLVKAWESCQERIRIHRNKPLPGVLRPVAKPKKKRTPLALVNDLGSAPTTAAEAQSVANAG